MACLASKKTVFHDFWSYRPQNNSILSKIWRRSWFWRPFGRRSPKTSPNWWKSDFLIRKFCRKKKNKIEKPVFRQSGEVLDELRPNGRQNQLQRQILLQIDFFWSLYDQKPSNSKIFRTRKFARPSAGCFARPSAGYFARPSAGYFARSSAGFFWPKCYRRPGLSMIGI